MIRTRIRIMPAACVRACVRAAGGRIYCAVMYKVRWVSCPVTYKSRWSYCTVTYKIRSVWCPVTYKVGGSIAP